MSQTIFCVFSESLDGDNVLEYTCSTYPIAESCRHFEAERIWYHWHSDREIDQFDTDLSDYIIQSWELH